MPLLLFVIPSYVPGVKDHDNELSLREPVSGGMKLQTSGEKGMG